MRILTLIVPLALTYPTLVTSKAVYLRTVHKNEEAPHLSLSHHPTTKRSYENAGDVSLLRRGVFPPPRSPSNRQKLAQLALVSSRATVDASASFRDSSKSYAKVKGDDNTISTSSHEVHRGVPSYSPKEVLTTTRNSAKIEGLGASAKAVAEAQGRKVTFKSDTRYSEGKGKFTVHGPGELQVVSRHRSVWGGPDDPQFRYRKLAEGDKEDIAILPDSKVKGHIVQEIRYPEEPSPKVNGRLEGAGVMKMKSKFASTNRVAASKDKPVKE